ncbi:hypothetical protein RB653_005214 [Dictyostelium firmibasis]|uniref:Uncharacterized protein n=1 Tax=Dictyostelium firmibasis TaxID=79012 RepID=A0AAN7U922_9MYCE
MMNNLVKRLPNLIIKSNRGLNNNNIYSVNKLSLTSQICQTQLQQQQQQQQINYATLSKKKFDEIKEKREEENRLLKEEKERKFIEQSKISIDDLPFEHALQNVREKFDKYHAVASNLIGTMFKKVKTLEELHQILKFYKYMKNSNPNYFRSSHILYIYYAFLRTSQVPLFAEMLIHSDKFQIFPKQNVIIKVLVQLFKQGDDQILLASKLFSTYCSRYSASVAFMTSFSIAAKSYIPSFLEMLRNYPTNLPLELGATSTKLLIRDSTEKPENIQKTLDIIYRFTTQSQFDQLDPLSKAELITFEIISNPLIDQHKFSSELLNNQEQSSLLIPLITSHFEKIFTSDKISENTKTNIQRNIKFSNIEPLKESLKAYL